MKRRVIFLIAIMVTVCWYGCFKRQETQIISLAQLNKIKCEWNEPKLSKWFYIGSEDGYHMFVHRDLPEDKYYEIKITEYQIDNPIILGTDESKWVLMPWGPGFEECKQ